MRSEEQDLSDRFTECPSVRQKESSDPGYVSACDVHQSSIDALTREVDGRLAKIESLLAYMQIRSAPSVYCHRQLLIYYIKEF